MALPKISFNISKNGLGRALPNSDHISGLVAYMANGSLPSGFTSSDRIKQVFSITQAEDLGITDTHIGETKAVAKVVIAGTPAVGDTLKITYAGIKEPVTVLDGYALVSGEETTATTAAAAWKDQINAGTDTHGFTATNTAGSLFVVTKEGEGIFPNSGTPYAVTVTGGSTATLTQPTGSGSTVLGVASVIDPLHYHISEYFRLQPQGNLYVGIYAVPSTFDGTEIKTVQAFANGQIRNFGVYYTNVAFSTAQIQALQARQDELDEINTPLHIVYGADISGTALLANLVTLAALDSETVSLEVGQDGYFIDNDGTLISGVGYKLFKATGKSITCLGAKLGAESLAKVNESIAWVGKFNFSDGTELEYPAFANGTLVSSVAQSQLDTLNGYKYNFLVKQIGIGGTYASESNTSTANTSDFAYIENVRTMQKAKRNIRTNSLPALNSPLVVNANGTLKDETVAYFESLANVPLDQMQRDTEISDKQAIVDPAQDVLATSQIVVRVDIVPVGVARKIVFNISYRTKI